MDRTSEAVTAANPPVSTGGGFIRDDDRKALNKELGKARAMTNILAAQSAGNEGRDSAPAGRPPVMRKLERKDVGRRRTGRSVADRRPGHQRRLCLAGNPVFPLQDTERRRPSRDEVSANHLRARPRQPTRMLLRKSNGLSHRASPASGAGQTAPAARSRASLRWKEGVIGVQIQSVDRQPAASRPLSECPPQNVSRSMP
jgi:hypothetical protein